MEDLHLNKQEILYFLKQKPPSNTSHTLEKE